ncbi:MAG: hypothetical protein NT062_21770 [Proteobacteria bacterium]|nr:hypothetical protein [Pseudomonadota bacterium]
MGTPRRVAIGQLFGGAILAIACYLILRVVHPLEMERSAQPPGWHRDTRVGGYVAIILALGIGTGLVFMYRGLIRLIGGARIDKLDTSRLTLAGALYALGFAAALGAALYLVVGVQGVRLF